jgi:hypothetical protein
LSDPSEIAVIDTLQLSISKRIPLKGLCWTHTYHNGS